MGSKERQLQAEGGETGGSGPSTERGEAGRAGTEGGSRPLATHRPGRAGQVKRPSSGLGRTHAPRPTPGHSSPPPSRPPDPSSTSSPGRRRSHSRDPHPELAAASPHASGASGTTGEGRGRRGGQMREGAQLGVAVPLPPPRYRVSDRPPAPTAARRRESHARR